MSIDEDLLRDFGNLSDELVALRDELCVAPDAATSDAHTAAMDRAVAELTPAPAPLPRRRARVVALAAAATVGVLGLTGGLAAAGSLPAPVQHQAARVAGAVGWEIPDHARPATPDPTPTSPISGRRSITPQPTAARSTVTAPPNPTAKPPAPKRTPAASTPSAPRPVTPTPPPATDAPAPAPGNSGAAPGHQDPVTAPSAPGHSGAAPGQAKRATVTTTAAPAAAPGKSGAAPGHNKP